MQSDKSSKIRRLKYIEAFSAVISTGSISAAARQLGVSQPAVSQLIRKLEDSIGAPLFIRRNGAIFPTSRAESMREDAIDLLSQVDKIQMQLSHSQTKLLSTIRLSASMTITNEILPILISQIHTDYPTGNFYVNSLPIVNMTEAILQGHVDFAFHNQTFSNPNIRNKELAKVPQVCVMPENHKLAKNDYVDLEELDNIRVITSSRKDPSYEYYRKLFNKHRIRTERVLQSPYAGFAMQMAEKLNAVSFNNSLIAQIVCQKIPGLTWRRVKGLEATTSYNVAHAGWLEGSETLNLIEGSFNKGFQEYLDEL